MVLACHLRRLLFDSILVKHKSILKPNFISQKPIACHKHNWGYKKTKIYKPLYVQKIMAEIDPKVAEILAPLRASVKEQGDLVRSLKADGAPELDVKKAVAELKSRKRVLEEKELELAPANAGFERTKMEDLIKRRFFFDNSFSIYGGITGQFDFGPMGTAVKNNMIQLWRNHFVLPEQMLEVDCTVLTPEPVLKASGHVDRFADLMVKDLNSGECFRLDHLIKAHLEKLCVDKKTTDKEKEEYTDIMVKLDGFNKDEMNGILRRFDMKSPITGNDLSDAIEFNLMFATSIGPSGNVKGFLRPETAQGIFVNFKRLLEFNQRRIPFSVAQVGNAFRNEISPRSGLIRVREFTMAEIEHFVDPRDKSHEKFVNVADLKLNLYSACNQMDGKSAEIVRLGDAVSSGLINNETLGFFIGRIYQFMIKVGVNKDRIRFRQHMSNEMAHYSSDCWDAETLTSYGWVECVGCADRSCYDLSAHSKATNVKLVAEKELKEPKIVKFTELTPNKGALGKAFKGDAQKVLTRLAELSAEEVETFEKDLEVSGAFSLILKDGNSVKINKEFVKVSRGEKKIFVEEYTPGVIEPSFGLGRIMHTAFEHNFRIRENDDQRTYFALPPILCPIKCSILPISNNAAFKPIISRISEMLLEQNIAFKVDDSSGSIGKRYARTDEISIPFAVTIDFDTEKDDSVTVRERDSLEQIRLPINDLTNVIRDLINAKSNWNDVKGKFKLVEKSSE